MSFEEQFAAARYNASYWMSWAFMFVLPVVGAVATGLLLPTRRARLRVYVVLALACFFGTAALSVFAIQEKWQRRYKIETATDAEARAVTADGANLVAAPFIGGFCGVFAALLAGATAEIVGRVKPAVDAKPRTAVSELQ